MARKDIKKIHKNLIIFSINSAKNIESKLDKKVIFLEENPYMYQYIEENNKLRRFFIDKYTVIYKIEKNKVFILKVSPKKSNYKKENSDILKFKF